MLSKRDLVAVTAIGAEVGLLVQPIIANLWADIVPALEKAGMGAPTPALFHIGAFIGFTLLAPIALTILSILSKTLPILYQFGKFAAVGSSNAFVDIGLLNLTLILMGIEKSTPAFTIAATATAFVATINSFLWNKFWTFEAGKSQEKPLMEIVKFYAVTGFSALINGVITGMVASSVGGSGVSDAVGANLGKLAGIFSALIFNFLGYKFIVFKKPSNASPAAAATR